MAEIEITMPNYDITKLQVIQKNNFLRSKKDDLTAIESKFVRFIIAQISREEDIKRVYSISLNRIIEEFNIDKSNAYREFSNMAGDLLKKVIYIENGTTDKHGNPNYKMFHWFSSFEYNNGEITVAISREIEEFLIVSKEFTRYYLTDAIELPTDNCIRLYELLISWGAKTVNAPALKYKGKTLKDNEVIYEISFLRRFFNCEEKYQRTNDFLKRVIDCNIKTIREKLCIDISYTLVKERNKTTALIFQIGNSFQK